MPWGQGASTPPGQYEPCGHTAQAVAPAEEKVPAAQGVQEVAPVVENVPAAQGRHVLGEAVAS